MKLALARLSRLGFINRGAEQAQAATYFSRLRVRAASPEVLSAEQFVGLLRAR